MTCKQFIEKRKKIWNKNLPEKDECREIANIHNEYIKSLEELVLTLQDENHHLGSMIDEYKKLYR